MVTTICYVPHLSVATAIAEHVSQRASTGLSEGLSLDLIFDEVVFINKNFLSIAGCYCSFEAHG